MENLSNTRGEIAVLTSRDALCALRQLSPTADPNERERVGQDLSLRLNLPGIIDVLHEPFGRYQEMVEIAGVSDKKVVSQWSRGIRRPHSVAVIEQFRLTLKICAIVFDNQNPKACRDWLNKPDDNLKNRSPIEVLVDKDWRGVAKSQEQLLFAAKQSRMNHRLPSN